MWTQSTTLTPLYNAAAAAAVHVQAAAAAEPEELTAEDEELRERLHAMRTS